MGSLTTCLAALRKAGLQLDTKTEREVTARRTELQAQGKSAGEAARQAVEEVIARREAHLDSLGAPKPINVQVRGKAVELQTLAPGEVGADAGKDSVARGPGRPISPETAKLLHAIGDALGKEVIFFQDPQGQVGDGFVRPKDSKRIYVNEATTIHPMAVVGHEFWHQVKRELPQVHAALTEVVKAQAKTAAVKKEYVGNLGYADGHVMEEFVSDLGGDLMADPKFWSQVIDKVQAKHPAQAQGLLDKLAELLQGLVDKVMKAVSSGKGPGFNAKQFVKDMDAVRTAFSDAMASHLDAQEKASATPEEQAAFSRERGATQTAAFKKWFGDSKVVDAAGRPLAVYHGTTHDITSFDRSRANIESDFGGGFYFSNTPEDVANNYAGEGPDLTARIEQLAEQMINRGEDDDLSIEEARKLAKKELSGGAPNTMKVYLSIKNPLIIGGKNETFLDFESVQDEEGEFTGDEKGTLADFVVALRGELENNSDRWVDGDIDKVVGDIMEKGMDGGMKASELIEVAKNSEGLSYVMDNDSPTGALAASELIRIALQEAGFDGVIDHTVNKKFGTEKVIKTPYGGTIKGNAMAGMGRETVHYIAFEPQQIKSAMGNSGKFDEKNPDVTQSKTRTFYSALAKGVEQLPSKQLTGAMWKDAVKGMVNKGLVKEDEVEWSGVRDWLDLQDGKVPKEDVLKFLADNGVQIQEVEKGGHAAASSALDQTRVQLDALGYSMSAQLGDSDVVLTRRSDGVRFSYDSREDAFVADQALNPGLKKDETLEGEVARLAQVADDVVNNNVDQSELTHASTRYGTYTLPGAQNYREILLTLPPPMVDVPQWKVIRKDGQVASTWDAETLAYNQADIIGGTVREQKVSQPRPGFYKSPHWGELNVLAHIRVDQRTDPKGNKVLFVEEIQSDWAQRGKKKGFDTPGSQNMPDVLARAHYESAGPGSENWRWRLPDGTGGIEPSRPAAERAAAASLNQRSRTGVPTGPFVQKTEAWVSLALKKVIKMAVDNGFDRVAFVNGQQSADRYDLSKQIDRLHVWGGEKEGYYFEAGKDGKQLLADHGKPLSADELVSTIGKDLAKKAIDKIGADGEAMFTGDGLKIGGEGMIKFYDQVLPAIANPMLKKLGGGKLAPVPVNIPVEDYARTARYVGPVHTFQDVAKLHQVSMRGGADVYLNPLTGKKEHYAINRVTNEQDLQKIKELMTQGKTFQEAMVDPNVSFGAAELFGGKVERFDVDDDVSPQLGFDITPEMKARAEDGLPMFSKYRKREVQVDGKWRPAENADGKPIHPTLVGQQQFWKWFKDSKVVDEHGRPRVVYHGTDDRFSEFAPSGHGSFGAGIYFTDSKKSANVYGENAVPVFLSLQNPVITKADFAPGEEYDLDSPAVGMVEKYVQQPLASRLIDRARNTDLGMFDKDLQAELVKQGYDGIIATYEDGSQEMVAFKPTQIKSATGNTGTFNPGSSDITQSAARNPDSLANDDVMLAAARAWQSTDPGRIDQIIYELQDNRVDLKRTQEAIKKAGNAIDEAFDARLAETVFPGRVAYRSKQFLDVEVKPLLEAMAKQKVPMNELGDYLLARHAPERNAQIARINPALPDGGAGSNSQGTLMTTKAASAYLAAIPGPRRAQLAALAVHVDQISNGTRQLLVSEGLEDRATIQAWDAAYKHYVPLFKDENSLPHLHPHPQGAGFSVKGPSSKRATGSKKEVTNVLAHLLMQREAAITRAEKNRVGIALYGLALENPNKDFWATIRPNMSNSAIIAELQAMGVDPQNAFPGMQAVPTIATIDKTTGQVVHRPNPIYKSLPGAISVKIKGEDRILMLNQKNDRALRMAESLKNLDGVTSIDWSTGVLHKYVWDKIPPWVGVAPATRWIASVNTQYNPAFGFVNFARDLWGGLINLGSTPLRGQTVKVMAMSPLAMKGIAADAIGKGQGNQWTQLWKQFQEDGGKTGYRETFKEAEDRAKKLEKEIAHAGTAGKLTPGNAAHAVLDVLDVFNTTMENAVRLSAYKAALDHGLSRKEAARLGRELTVDFNRKGRMGREYGPIYAFFNASTQGIARHIETIKGPTGKRVIAGGLALGMLQAFMLIAAGYDDEDIPEFVKVRSLIIPLPRAEDGTKRFVSIPYPLGLHVIPNTGRVITELTMNGGKDLGQRTFNAIGELAAAINPVGGGNIFTLDGALKTVAPTVIDPAIELGFNKNFAGYPIEKKPFKEEDPRPGHQRAREQTMRTATGQAYLAISKAFNKMTGGTDFEAGAMSPTPERIKYLVETVGGGVAREVEKSVDSSVKAYNGDKVKMSQIPALGRFYGEVDSNQTEQSRYFKKGADIDKVQASLAAAKKAMTSARTDEAREAAAQAYERIATDNQVAVAIASRQDKIQREIQKLNKQAVETVNDPEEMRRIDEARSELMKNLNETITDVEASMGAKPTLGAQLREKLRALTGQEKTVATP